MAATNKTRATRKPRASAPKGMTLHLPETGGGYSKLPGSKNGAAYTAALLIVTGFASLTKAGRLTMRKGGGNPKALKAGMGSGPYGYHVRKGNLKGAALTHDGVNFFNARLGGEAQTWNTSADLAREMVVAVQKGGEVKITDTNGGERKVAFDHSVTVE